MNKRIINNYDNYKKFINIHDNKEDNNYIPPIFISSNNILEIYNILNIEDLELFIKNNIDNIEFLTFQRVFNSWLIVNFKQLKKYINYLVYIFIFILNHFYQKIKGNNNELFNNKKLNSELKIIIKLWIKNKKQNDFFFNFWHEIKNELLKKNIQL